jgi:hypothetical protein
MYKTLTALILAAATNCPLVDVAGTYTFTIRTEQASSWYGVGDPVSKAGCRKTGGTKWGEIVISPDGSMVGKSSGGVSGRDFLVGNPGQGGSSRNLGVFGGRVEPGSEPMQWVASAADIEMKGIWKRGQISGEFVQRFIEGGKEIECRGKVSGFKTGK